MITLASIGRFHFLEQARALSALGRLDRSYCDDPRVIPAAGWRRGRWLAKVGVWRRAGLAAGISRESAGAFAAAWAGPRAGEWTWCGGELARATAGASLVKINSAFALETLRRGSAGEVWVDHGSLDERYVASCMRQEAELTGEPLAATGGNHSSPELLDRQGEEFARARGIVVASELARQSLVAQGVPAEKVRAVPLGVDVELFRPVAPTRRRPFRILHAGPISFNKGVHRLIDAFRAAALPEAELWIVGPRPSQPVLERFQSRAAGMPPGKRVQFGPGVPQRSLPQLFAGCDLFVLATLADGFGLTVLQAMACGLPAVVTEQAGCAMVLAGCPAVRVVPAGQTRALAAALTDQFERRVGLPGEWPPDAGARQWVCGLDWTGHARQLCGALRAHDSGAGAPAGPEDRECAGGGPWSRARI